MEDGLEDEDGWKMDWRMRMDGTNGGRSMDGQL